MGDLWSAEFSLAILPAFTFQPLSWFSAGPSQYRKILHKCVEGPRVRPTTSPEILKSKFLDGALTARSLQYGCLL